MQKISPLPLLVFAPSIGAFSHPPASVSTFLLVVRVVMKCMNHKGKCMDLVRVYTVFIEKGYNNGMSIYIYIYIYVRQNMVKIKSCRLHVSSCCRNGMLRSISDALLLCTWHNSRWCAKHSGDSECVWFSFQCCGQRCPVSIAFESFEFLDHDDVPLLHIATRNFSKFELAHLPEFLIGANLFSSCDLALVTADGAMQLPCVDHGSIETVCYQWPI